MDLSLHNTTAGLPEGQLKGKHVVVIDVLRASSTIVHAYENGVERIIPVAEVEDATKLVPTLERKKTLLGGERDGKRIDGFDLGNSPFEYTSKVLEGKTLIFCTSNGTKAVARSAAAAQIAVACFLNMSAVVDHLLSSRSRNVAVLCAGNAGQLSLEDFVCGGMIIDRLAGTFRGKLNLNDGAVAARSLADSLGDPAGVVRSSVHGRRLAELGFEEDLDFCARVDRYGSVPTVVEGRIAGQNAAHK